MGVFLWAQPRRPLRLGGIEVIDRYEVGRHRGGAEDAEVAQRVEAAHSLTDKDFKRYRLRI